MSDFGITDELVEHVKAMEGFRSNAYLDPVGLPTIGYGQRVESLDVPPVTIEEATTQLNARLREFRDDAIRLSPILQTASPRRLAAIVDFCYNAGPTNYSISTLRKAVDAGDWNEAAVQIKRWVYGGRPKRVIQDLVQRREIVAKWLIDG